MIVYCMILLHNGENYGFRNNDIFIFSDFVS